MVMIDKECHACYMKVSHLRHDKDRRFKNRSHYTKPQILIDWDQVRVKNNFGKVVIRKKA